MEVEDSSSSSAAEREAPTAQEQLHTIHQFRAAQNVRMYLPGETLCDTLSTCFWFHFRLPYLGQRGFRRRPEIEGKEVPVAGEGGLPPVEEGAGHYVWLTYGQVWRYLTAFGSGLAEFLKKNDIVGICGKNSIEWAVVDLACVYQGFAAVPLHTILDDDSLEFILNQTEMSCIVCDYSQLSKLSNIVNRCPYLKHIIVMTPIDAKEMEKEAMMKSFASQAGDRVQVYNFTEIENQGHMKPKDLVTREANDIATIMYTSGTTGKPKGAVMTDARWNKFITKPYLLPQPSIILSHGPLAHVQERQNYYISMCSGGREAFFDQDMSQLLNEAQLIRPTWFSAVPRVWNFIHSEYHKAVDAALQADSTLSKEVVEARVLESLRGSLGGRVEFIVTGGAPTSPHIIQFLERCFGCKVWNGYGTTETGGISNNNFINSDAQVRLIDVPDLGYTSQDTPNPRGEICVLTHDNIQGYYKDEKATSESFIDGWFRTGDIGEKLPSGEIVIIDRKKNIFKLSQGEFVVPEKLENAYIESGFIDQVFIYGGPSKTYLVAVIVPNKDVLLNWINVNVPEAAENLNHSRVHTKLLEEIQRVATRLNFASFEIPRAVYVDTEKFSAENGLLTASQKLCRGKLERHYKMILESMYEADDVKEDDIVDLLALALQGDWSGLSDSMQRMTLAQMGLDSLSTVNFVTLIRERCGREIPLAFLFQSPTVKDIIDYLQDSSTSITKPASGNHPALGDLLAQEQLLQLGDFRGALTDHSKQVLLTGATGFLGIHLLDELLSLSTCERVHCLVRCSSAKDGLQRLANAFSKHSINTNLDVLASRVTVWPSDLGQPLLGLSSATYELLSKSVSEVYHCGAVVNWLHPYETMRGPNVMATLTLLTLATTGRCKRFHHVSTIGVAGPEGDEESMWPTEWLSSLSGYSLSKWVAEHYVREAASQGVDVRIYRPGMVGPHTSTGASNAEDYLNRYLAGVVGLGMYIETEGNFDITPVDYVSRAIVALSNAQLPSSLYSSSAACFHLTNPGGCTYSQLGQYIATSAKEVIQESATIVGVPYDQWRSAFLRSISIRKEGNALYGLLPYFSETYGDQLQRQARPFTCEKTLNVLPESIEACAPVTQQLVTHFLLALRRRGVLPPAVGSYLA